MNTIDTKIITLGTSHGDPTFCRFNSSTILQAGESLYLIDAGAPVNALMIRHGLKMQNLKAVFITHMHEDHVGGLSGLIKSLVKRPVKDQHTTIFMPEENAATSLLGWMQSMHRTWSEDLLTFKTTTPKLIFSDDTIQVTALATRHIENKQQFFSSYAYQFNFAGKQIIYTGDLKHDFSDFPTAALDMPSDLCICECTHFNIETALSTLSKCQTKQMIFNHVGDDWHGRGEKTLQNIIDTLPFPCKIAHDGNEFVI
jgi:ribonuclease BN (tRNA processing enzyme)